MADDDQNKLKVRPNSRRSATGSGFLEALLLIDTFLDADAQDWFRFTVTRVAG